MKNLIHNHQVECVEIGLEAIQIFEKEIDNMSETIAIERSTEQPNSMKFPGLGGELIPYVEE